MSTKNPYTISFGKIPSKYLSRNYVIDSIAEAFERDVPDEQAFKLTGIRGTGKTVTLTAIEQHFRDDEDWIVIGIRSDSDIISELVAHLYSSVPMVSAFVDANLNLSAFGIGLNITSKSPVASIDYALKVILSELKKSGKHLLVTIDEARKTKGIVDFIQEFQILIREELPIFVIVAGLYEDIESLENAEGLTFFLRATKYEMSPLNITYIRDDYKDTLGIDFEEAEKMAFITKGYAYAYQTLGKYMWDSKEKYLTKEVLRKFDEVLSEKVYKKIWSELAPKDKWFLQFIVKKETMEVGELLELTKTTHSTWSVPRSRLSEKGIIDASNRGTVSILLPRFKEFIEGLGPLPELMV
ncbi:ATP-binding protein [Butyrivibrio sp. WCD3002]|uniref:ATP-binding protein n=1 Tax=Butyrivibrio sp. WCD3002 TaxID=1280676 RepID=UPI0003FBC2F6|nr:ATP-binding protein [Butyrivibrio sp. WCD3002]